MLGAGYDGAVGLALGLGVRPGAWLSGLLLLAAGLAVWGAWNRVRRGLVCNASAPAYNHVGFKR